MKAIEQYVLVVLFIMMYKLVRTFKSVDKTPVCDHFSNESYRAVLSRGTYLLLTEFEGRTVSYGPFFFPCDLWPKREARGP